MPRGTPVSGTQLGSDAMGATSDRRTQIDRNIHGDPF